MFRNLIQICVKPHTQIGLFLGYLLKKVFFCHNTKIENHILNLLFTNLNLKRYRLITATMKKTVILIILVVLFFFGFKGWQYYNENDQYAQYVLKSYWQTLELSVDNGYSDKTSYNIGEVQKVFIDAKNTEKRILKLYDINYNVVDSLQAQVHPQHKGENPSENGYGYQETFNYKIPALKSGLYLWEKCIPFIIKGAQEEEIVVLYPTNTINAYNISGGKSLYSLFSEKTHIVSFRRPTFPAVSFQVKDGMEFLNTLKNLPLRYIADQDMENYEAIEKAKLLIVVGHSEYWTRNARENFDRFVDSGGNALILSGNTMWWQVRYRNDGEQMICYKEMEDPIDDEKLSTTFWTNAILDYPVIPSIGVDFPNGGFGRKYEDSFQGLKIIASASPIFEEIAIEPGQIISIPTKEYDGTLVKTGKNEPLLDTANLPFYEAELLAYDYAYSEDKGLGTFMIFQKSNSSGTVINTATMDWCSGYGLGGRDSTIIQQITINMIEGLWKDRNLFSPN